MYMSERSEALFTYFMPKYQDFLQCVLFCGGCVFHSQMSRLLFKNQSDCKRATQLANNLIEARIFNKQRSGKNNLYTLTAFALHHFDVKYPQSLTASRLKLSSLVFESFLQRGYYAKSDPAKAMLERLNKSGMAFFSTQGMQQLRQMLHLKDAFAERGFSTEGIDYQIQRMKKRVNFAILSDNHKGRLDLPKEPDLFSISCKNIYLSGVTLKPNSYGKERPVALVEIYYIGEWLQSIMADNIIEAKRLIEDTLQNDALAIFTVHSHGKRNPRYEQAVKGHLLKNPEFLTPEDINNTLSFKWYDTRMSLFSNVDPKNYI